MEKCVLGTVLGGSEGGWEKKSADGEVCTVGGKINFCRVEVWVSSTF